MFEQELTYQDLHIPSSEIYEAMGYKDSIPDPMVIEETHTLLKRIIPRLRPRYTFFLTEGTVDTEKESLHTHDTVFSIGKTIARQLRGSEAFAFFAATAGIEFEEFQHTLQQEGDMVKIYIADSLGLFPVTSPCGIRLTDSSLMIPIKSVSGVIGVGTDVRKLEYTCGLCTYENCYRKRKHQ